ncbi:hypothetical protein [Streptomyces sp. CB03238]|uniref:hypothetical protein n=1 Tax=Streptomyces sp. CB03238 TaxID=1907777 RepID=UPI00117C3D60|nr:hypothetical protein [Streptomyces sp. CB03238]
MTRTTTDSGGYTRTILPPRRPRSAAPAPAPVPWPMFGGDELRVRAWLWRTLGVGAAATGRHQ